MDAVDVEILIAEVQKRSPLYDTTIKEYRDTNEKKKLWSQICEVIYTPEAWDELSSTEKVEYEKYVQNKWATLRRGFRREIALQKSTPPSAAKKRKKYVYFNLLQFLLPFATLEDNESSLEKDENMWFTSEKSNPSANQFLEVNVECSVPESKRKLHSTYPNMNNDEQILDEENPLIVTNTHKVTEPVTNKTDDDDEAFFKSLIPSMKQFTSDEKLLVRIEIMKTILNFKKSLNYPISIKPDI